MQLQFSQTFKLDWFFVCIGYELLMNVWEILSYLFYHKVFLTFHLKWDFLCHEMFQDQRKRPVINVQVQNDKMFQGNYVFAVHVEKR